MESSSDKKQREKESQKNTGKETERIEKNLAPRRNQRRLKKGGCGCGNRKK